MGEERKEGKEGREGRSKPEGVAPSRGQSSSLSLSLSVHEREREVRLGPGGDASVAALTRSAVTSACFSFFLFFVVSLVCYAQFLIF